MRLWWIAVVSRRHLAIRPTYQHRVGLQKFFFSKRFDRINYRLQHMWRSGRGRDFAIDAWDGGGRPISNMTPSTEYYLNRMKSLQDRQSPRFITHPGACV
jgi:hypothetical protein